MYKLEEETMASKYASDKAMFDTNLIEPSVAGFPLLRGRPTLKKPIVEINFIRT